MANSTEPERDELRPEYDFRVLRGVTRGKYAARYRERPRVVRLADDVASAFADESAVNDALRKYLQDHPPRRFEDISHGRKGVRTPLGRCA
jgi:hypothetical protein